MGNLSTDMIICLQYSIISLICTLSLIYFIIVTDRSAEHSKELLFYKLAIAFTALCSFADIFYSLREFGDVKISDAANYVFEILYSLGSLGGAYCWFGYAESKQGSKIYSSFKLLKIFMVPFVIMALFTVSTPLHKLCFYFDGNHYVRGVLNVPFTVICSSFVVYSGISSLIRSFNKKYYSKAVLLRLLFSYTVLLALAETLQLFVGSVMPFRCLFATLVFMVITLRGMTEIVTVDALSNVNNRFAFDHAMDLRLSSDEEFYLIMLDVDNFKRINDTYGHITGDNAIRYTAQAIIKAVPHNYFVARYGGDEFAIIAPADDKSVIESTEGKIQDALNDIVKTHNSPLEISISSGYARRSKQDDNAPDIIEKADAMLYEKKHIKKNS